MKKYILIGLFFIVQLFGLKAQFLTEELSFSGGGDLTMGLGKYRIGTAITILAEIQGGYAEDGGVYHIVGDWNQLPKITYRNESSISSRLKFYGYVDEMFYMYLFATWENTSPDKTNSNTVRLTINSSGFFDITAQGDFANSSELVSLLTIQSNTENIGVGTTTPNHKLDVEGTIRAHEIKVNLDEGADFVFEEDYNLMPLKELETFVKTQKHLPEVAPAKEMEAEGLNLSEMNIKLLQKIEELTLYTIEQGKTIDNLLEKVEKQGSEIEKLKNKKH